MSTKKKVRNALAVALAVALCQPAAAQQDAPAGDAASRKQSAHELESVVVTATKIEQPLQETPMAVSALGAKELERRRIERFDDYLGQVPAMTSIATRPGSTQLILRGISAGSQPNSMVSVYVDESPYGVTSSFARAGYLTPDFDPYDMQRIEVLRGPQGTLYGANSLGGARHRRVLHRLERRAARHGAQRLFVPRQRRQGAQLGLGNGVALAAGRRTDACGERGVHRRAARRRCRRRRRPARQPAAVRAAAVGRGQRRLRGATCRCVALVRRHDVPLQRRPHRRGMAWFVVSLNTLSVALRY